MCRIRPRRANAAATLVRGAHLQVRLRVGQTPAVHPQSDRDAHREAHTEHDQHGDADAVCEPGVVASEALERCVLEPVQAHGLQALWCNVRGTRGQCVAKGHSGSGSPGRARETRPPCTCVDGWQEKGAQGRGGGVAQRGRSESKVSS